MNFGQAIEFLKAGQRVARAGWNGKGMWVVLMPGAPGREWSWGVEGETAPCLGMKTATGVLQPGWLASQADMLAEDWEALP